MTLQVLVATMNQTDYSLPDKMNIQSDAVVVNQCDKNDYAEFDYNGHKIKWISQAERGVGLSRNTAMKHADADILLFADDDVVYHDGYAEKVCGEFAAFPKIDLITFNIQSLNPARPEYIDHKKHRLHFCNSLRYGAARIAVRKETADRYTMSFSPDYGGGAPHEAGEDNLFVIEALKKGSRLMASDIMIADVKQTDSTWFEGYDEKYYYDRGYLFADMFGRWAALLMPAFEIKDIKRVSRLSFAERYNKERQGIRDCTRHRHCGHRS